MILRASLALAFACLAGFTTWPASHDPVPAGEAEVTVGLIIDFPGKHVRGYVDVPNHELVHAIDRAEGDLVVSRVRKLPPLGFDTIQYTDGLPTYDIVRTLVDTALTNYAQVSGGLKFKKLRKSLADEIFGESAGVGFDGQPIDHYARLADDEDISCVRWRWINGDLVVEYNYSLEVKNPAQEPSVDQTIGHLEPKYSVLASFTLRGQHGKLLEHTAEIQGEFASER